MKALKLGVFALAIGFFAASCAGNTNSDETTPQDQVETTTPDQTTEPATTAPDTDTAMQAPATTDTPAAE